MEPIRTERLIIRNFRPDDWQALQKMVVKYMASEYAAYDHKWPEGDEAIKGVAKWFASGDNYAAVCLADSGTFIGFVCVNPEGDEGTERNLGYIFDSDYHGHGYATEACRATLHHAFGALGVEQVVTGTALVNLPSCRLLGRLGFRSTGEGTFALSKDEWAASQG